MDHLFTSILNKRCSDSYMKNICNLGKLYPFLNLYTHIILVIRGKNAHRRQFGKLKYFTMQQLKLNTYFLLFSVHLYTFEPKNIVIYCLLFLK